MEAHQVVIQCMCKDVYVFYTLNCSSILVGIQCIVMVTYS